MGLPRAGRGDGDEHGREALDGGVPGSRATGKGQESLIGSQVVLAKVPEEPTVSVLVEGVDG